MLGGSGARTRSCAGTTRATYRPPRLSRYSVAHAHSRTADPNRFAPVVRGTGVMPSPNRHYHGWRAQLPGRAAAEITARRVDQRRRERAEGVLVGSPTLYSAERVRGAPAACHLASFIIESLLGAQFRRRSNG